jgi:hypothetical protein
LIRAVLVLLLASTAFADTTRVLLADADPELQSAVKATLAPWRLEVVIEGERPSDTTHAQMIGDAKTARFVVWRERGDLVVLDRERGAAEHREAPEGALDPASAAAAALTVKTLMRLPPPPEVAEVTPPVEEPKDQIVVPVEPASPGPELRVQAGVASRMTRGEDGALGARASIAVFVKPSRIPLRLGIAGELGPSSDVQAAGFKGTWNDWSVLGLASYAFAVDTRWEIEPFVGAGVLRSSLDGEEMMMERHERATLAVLRGGVFGRARLGWFSIGATLGFDAIPGTPTYTKVGASSEVFAVPPLALSAGLFVAADLNR